MVGQCSNGKKNLKESGGCAEIIPTSIKLA